MLVSGIGLVRRAVVVVAVIVCAQTARAGFTDVLAAPGSELGHAEILTGIYDGTFRSANVAKDGFFGFTNDTGINAYRIHDFAGGGGPGDPLDLLGTGSSGATDQVWMDGIASIQAVGRYAAFSQTFGSFDGASGGTLEELFAISGSGFVVDGESSSTFTGDWRWGRGGGGGTWSSLASDNDDDDHMVTYRVEGLANGADATWLLFWEDLPGLGDQDYNDLVIEVMAIVPLPPAVWLGSLGLAAVFVLRRKIL